MIGATRPAIPVDMLAVSRAVKWTRPMRAVKWTRPILAVKWTRSWRLATGACAAALTS